MIQPPFRILSFRTGARQHQEGAQGKLTGEDDQPEWATPSQYTYFKSAAARSEMRLRARDSEGRRGPTYRLVGAAGMGAHGPKLLAKLRWPGWVC